MKTSPDLLSYLFLNLIQNFDQILISKVASRTVVFLGGFLPGLPDFS
jgi:hypothetical protein